MFRFLRPGWLMLYVLLFVLISTWIGGLGDVQMPRVVTIAPGGVLASVYDDLDTMDSLSLRRYLRRNADMLETLQPGSYQFGTGSLSPSEVVDVFNAGPKVVYESIRILEGWSIYDVDDMLVQQGYIEPDEYIQFVSDQTIISRYAERYPFVGQAVEDAGGRLVSLEGYLYPETYNIDIDKNILDQLVFLQLETFNQRIRTPYGQELADMNTQLSRQGYDFSLSSYGAVRLASVIEKEERTDANKDDIASVFYNRLDTGMRIDADITLCYGLDRGYEKCTPDVIVANLYDASNPYNTRAVAGLPPTPISNIHVSSIQALVNSIPSNNFYYLHDPTGQIHFGATIQQHNANKERYLR